MSVLLAAVLLQILGLLLVVAAVSVLVGIVWGVLAAGVIMFAAGYMIERGS